MKIVNVTSNYGSRNYTKEKYEMYIQEIMRYFNDGNTITLDDIELYCYDVWDFNRQFDVYLSEKEEFGEDIFIIVMENMNIRW